MENNVITDFYSVADINIRVEEAVFTDFNPASDVRVSENFCIIADNCIA